MTIIHVHVNIILDSPMTSHQSVNMELFFSKTNENTYPKGKAFMQFYRVVPQAKRGN